MDTSTSNTAPLYAKIVDDIKAKILNGTYKCQDRLPNEKWLCETYDISRTTLRKAIDELIAEGLVERVPSKGVYVLYSKFDSRFDRPYSVFTELKKAGIKPSSKIISFRRRGADAELSKKLDCKEGTPLLEITRIRYADDVPYALQKMFLKEELFPNFNPWNLIDNSFFDIMKNEYHIDIVKSVQIVNVTSAAKEQADLLETTPRAPLLFTTSTVYAKDKGIVEYQNNFIRTEVVPYSYKTRWV